MAKRPVPPRRRAPEQAPAAEPVRPEPAHAEPAHAEPVRREPVRREPARPAARAAAPAPEREPEREPASRTGVVPAADRFRRAVAGRPWQRRRRQVLAGAVVVLVLLAAVLAAAVFLPQLQVRKAQVEGLGYVREDAVRAAVAEQMGTSVLLLPTSAAEAQVEKVPGVLSAKVERRWPDTMRITVREREPIARLAKPGGATAILDETGAELPAEAGAGARLAPLAVGPGSSDPKGAIETMTAVLGAMPQDLRAGTTSMSATSRSDVTLKLKLEDGAEKTVVWGDAEDPEIKGKAVRALLGEPGSVIDVSSPVAPVTR